MTTFAFPTQLDAAAITTLCQQTNSPLLACTPFQPAIFCLTDYTAGDLALKEVSNAITTACLRTGVTTCAQNTWPIPGLDTVAAAFEGAQLAFNSTLGFGAIFYINCDPRLGLKTAARRDNTGGHFVVALLPNGVTYFSTDSGNTLSLLKASGAQLYQLKLDATGTQFRSRDFFPWVVALYARHLQDAVAKQVPQNHTDYKAILQSFPLLGPAFDAAHVPALAEGCVLYTDNFGNLKLNIWHDTLTARYPVGTRLTIDCNGKSLNGVISGGSFEVPNDTLAISRSSSGWPSADGNKRCLTELFIPGQRVADLLGNPKNGTVIQLTALAVPEASVA